MLFFQRSLSLLAFLLSFLLLLRLLLFFDLLGPDLDSKVVLLRHLHEVLRPDFVVVAKRVTFFLLRIFQKQRVILKPLFEFRVRVVVERRAFKGPRWIAKNDEVIPIESRT